MFWSVVAIFSSARADVPAPLATKIYYSQRNNRLRSEIGYMFHAADSQELDYNRMVEATELDITQSKISLQRSTPSGQVKLFVKTQNLKWLLDIVIFDEMNSLAGSIFTQYIGLFCRSRVQA